MMHLPFPQLGHDLPENSARERQTKGNRESKKKKNGQEISLPPTTAGYTLNTAMSGNNILFISQS